VPCKLWTGTMMETKDSKVFNAPSTMRPQPAGNEQILMGRERVITPPLEEDKVTASPDQPWALTRPMIRANGIHGVGFGGRFASASCSGRHSDFRSIQRRTDAARTIKETGPCERITS